eukprot:4500545-Pleurochrysis_carterae.AAC.1
MDGFGGGEREADVRRRDAHVGAAHRRGRQRLERVDLHRLELPPRLVEHVLHAEQLPVCARRPRVLLPRRLRPVPRRVCPGAHQRG